MFLPPPPGPADDPGARQDMPAAYSYAAKLLESGSSPADVRRRLLEMGWDEKTASLCVVELLQAREGKVEEASGSRRQSVALSKQESQTLREIGQKNMLYGALWFLGGLVVTLLTFTAAQGGGRYVIAWGAVVFGAIQFMRGYVQSGGPPAGGSQVY
jgi:hypothetical protein